MKKFRKRLAYLLFDFIRITAGLPGLIWFRPKRIYAGERAKRRIHGGALLIANHIGFFDPVYLMLAVWYRRHHFICMKEFFERPVARFFFRLFLCIPIDRENFGLDSFRTITAHLQDGELVSMFPEGHVNFQEGQTQTFKSGMILMALKSGKPIIPVYLKKRAHFYSRLEVVIGEAVDVTELYGAKPTFSQIDAAVKLLQQREQELGRLAEPLNP